MSFRITIIDDDANARIIAATLLELRGFDIQTLPGSSVDKACFDDSDLVLLDLDSAGVGGLRAMRRRRGQFDRDGGPRLIVAVPCDAPDTMRFAARMRPDAILRKPLDPRALIGTVETLLSDRIDHPAADAG